MFKEAFSWLYSHTTDLSLTPSSITVPECLQAIDVATQHHEQVLKTYRGLKYCPSQNSESLQTALLEVQLSEQYLAFLKTSEALLQDLQPHPMYELMLKIAFQYPSLRPKIAPVFGAWLAQESTLAIEYYETYYDGVSHKVGRESPEAEMLFLLGEAVVQHYLAGLRIALQYQDNPLAICRFMGPISANPTRYVAFMIWMLEQRLSIDQLVQSGVLQQFLGYHFDSLHSDLCDEPLNPTALLYGLLQRFDCAVALVNYAKQVACDIPGYAAYDLHGQQRGTLLIINCINEFPLLTRTSANIERIINVFGQLGLRESVRTLFHCTDRDPLADPFHRFLIELIQATPTLITPALIKQVADYSAMELQKWAFFVDDSFFQGWLDSRELALLYLIPHKPHWLNHVTVSMMQSYLQSIQAAYHPGSEAENIRLLMCLYQIASLQNVDLLESIYERMIDLILRHRYLLEDNAIFRLLRSSPFAEKYADKRANALMKNLEEIVHAFLSQPLDDADFSRLKSDWNWLYEQIEALQLLNKFKVIFPKEEIDLIVYLFEQHSQTERPSWDRLMDALQLKGSGSEPTSKKNRQALLGILTKVDDNHLRHMILDMLRLDQASLLAVNPRFFLDAIHAGNKGLLDWYLQVKDLDDRLLDQAINSQQWSMIEHWIVNYELPEFSTDLIDRLLIAVSGSQNIGLLRRLIHDCDYSFSKAAIAQALRVASQHDDDKALYSLYYLKPSPMALKVAFAQAIENQSHHALAFFTGMKKAKPNLAFEMQRAFNAAVRTNDIALVSRLTQCAANGPPRKVIQVAMEKAMELHQTEMVNLLNGILHPSSSPKVVPKKVKSSKSFCSTDSLAHLSLFSSPMAASLSAEELRPAAARASATPL